MTTNRLRQWAAVVRKRRARNIREYPEAKRSISERADADATPIVEEEEMLDPIQLCLFLEEENDL